VGSCVDLVGMESHTARVWTVGAQCIPVPYHNGGFNSFPLATYLRVLVNLGQLAELAGLREWLGCLCGAVWTPRSAAFPAWYKIK
jgi:hypothetical protein